MDAPSNPSFAATAPRVSWRERALAGLTWKGIALVALICALNGTRRVIQNFGDVPLAEWLGDLAQASALGLLVAFPVVASAVVTYNLAPPPPWRRALLLVPAIAAASLAGVAAHVSVESFASCGGALAPCFDDEPWTVVVLRAWVRYGTLCALFGAVFAYLRFADESAGRALEAERDRARFVQRMEEARLRMLQAQIEPHFLFNTLANVRRLARTDAAAADSMLENLIRYLAVALPQMRASSSTVGREATLAEAYLAIQQIRMGPRLAFAVEVPPALRDTPLPPMMLLTLVENAIKHGIAPLPEGGVVRVEASLVGAELQVRVADTGRGFTQSSGTGTGLANIRARLAATNGRLTLALNVPRGVTATLALPHPATPSAATTR